MRPPFWSNSDDPAGKVRWLYDIDPNYIQWQGAMISQYFPISSYKGSQEPIVTPLPFFDRDQELDDLEKRTKDLSIVNETKEAEVRAKIGCATGEDWKTTMGFSETERTHILWKRFCECHKMLQFLGSTEVAEMMLEWLQAGYFGKNTDFGVQNFHVISLAKSFSTDWNLLSRLNPCGLGSKP